MGYKVDNAIILAAGTSSRFAPLSYEKPKALITVRGEVLIERQIEQLNEAGIEEIVIVTGYKKECFEYLKEKYGALLIENPEYNSRNSHSSIYAAKKYIGNSYICSADNYFSKNPFEANVEESYYSVVYAQGDTAEWCVRTDEKGYINEISIGGQASWFMLGHVFWDEAFSKIFLDILEREYHLPKTREKFWEDIYIEHIEKLHLKSRRYEKADIFEFDSLEELREFDSRYKDNSGSSILQSICQRLGCKEQDICGILPIKGITNEAQGFCFKTGLNEYAYEYVSEQILQKK